MASSEAPLTRIGVQRISVRAESHQARSPLSRVVSCGVVRLFLVIWLAAFAAQATDLLALVAPDECTEETRGTAGDPCDDGCRALHVLRPRAGLRSSGFAPARTDVSARLVMLPPTAPSAAPIPRGIFHVPKHSLS